MFRTTSLFVVCTVASFGIGCDDTTPDVVTTSPSASQIQLCRMKMHINRQAPVDSAAFKRTQLVDEKIWFKFKTQSVVGAQLIFDDKYIDIGGFKPGFSFSKDADENDISQWWDPHDKSLLGGQISLKHSAGMDVGIEQHDSSHFTVYIKWQKNLIPSKSDSTEDSSDAFDFQEDPLKIQDGSFPSIDDSTN